MNEEQVMHLLELVAAGDMDVAEAVSQLKDGPLRDDVTGFATPDYHRRLRMGLAEVVYAEHKSAAQVLEIVRELARGGAPILVTRIDEAKQRQLAAELPDARINSVARTLLFNAPARKDVSDDEPFVAIVAAGTSDLHVVEEAADVCLAMEVAFEKIVDVGVAGLHRVVQQLPTLRRAAAVVVVAGMDGVLPSVVGGLIDKPVIGVPTSVGYGASLGGVAALLTMLNSCAPGVTVTNIDNGFCAGVAACKIARGISEAPDGRGARSETQAGVATRQGR